MDKSHLLYSGKERVAIGRQLASPVRTRKEVANVDETPWLGANLRQFHPTLDTVYCLVQEFAVMLRTRQGDRLDAWLKQIRSSHIPELLSFCKGIERNKTAVQGALQLPLVPILPYHTPPHPVPSSPPLQG